MPSGSHGGGGGSHSGSSGFSFSGGHSGGGGSIHSSRPGGPSHYRPRPHRTFIFWGHSYMPTTRQSSIFSFLNVIIVLALIISLPFLTTLLTIKQDLNNQIIDYNRYQEFCLSAQTQNKVFYGMVTDYHAGYGGEKYYINYIFPCDENGVFKDKQGNVVENPQELTEAQANQKGIYWGYSYTIYSQTQAQNLYKTPILLASDNYENQIDKTTDTMPMDYLGISITQDGDYMHFLGQKNKALTGLLVCVGIVILSVVINVVLSVKFSPSASVNSNGNKEPQNNSGGGIVSKRCPYCDGVLTEGQTHCNDCGAKVL